VALLDIIQTTAKLLSIPSPSAVVDSTDIQVQQLLALANEEGHELARRHEWQALKRQQTFTTVAAAEQPGAAPDDLDHFLPDSFFDRTTRRQLMGPITPQMWQAIQAQPQLNSVFLAFRQRDNAFLITPTPSAGDTIAYEYVSTSWAESASGEAKAEFTADTDVTVLQERLFWLGIRWRFRKSKQLDYAEDFRTYEIEVQKVAARDGGPGMVDITGRTIYNAFGFPNVPLGNWPS
jgi:hypothetical protein